MRFRTTCILAAASLAGSGSTHADEPKGRVVAVRYEVTEQVPDRLVQTVADPLQRTLMELPGVTQLNSAVSHGHVSVEVKFEGVATEKDVATVSRRVEQLVLESEVVVTSRTVHLTSPRMAR
jgi:multidrug efflux pump subunit AcrB